MTSARISANLLLFGFFLLGCGCSATSEGKTRLRVWSMWTGDEEKVFRDLLRYYERTHPHITFENVSTNYEDSKTIRAIIAGSPPDFCTIADPKLIGQLAANNALRCLDDLFKKQGFRREAFTPGSIGQCLYKGKLYAMPYLVDCYALLWNKDAFIAAGLDPERPPRTLDELQQFAVRLTQRDENGNLTRLGCQIEPQHYGLLLAVFGGRLYDPERDAITADDPRNVAALRWYKQFLDAQGGLAKVNAFSQGFGLGQSANNPFFVGKIAMMVNGQWNPYWAFRYAPRLRYGAAAFPPRTAQPPYTWLGGNFFVIPTGSRHVQEAWDFFAWMQTDEAQFRFADTMHGVPNTFTALRDERLRRGESWRPVFGKFLDIAGSRNAAYFPVLPITGFYDNLMTHAVEAVGFGSKTPEDALRDVQERVSREYAKWQ
ncbi:MAG: ABC transporter substrate-binding protein [Abditibacteriales bacterium]|nr:ABC transporter substrate-binding protein [Abditibacteriales bacterium]MDW8364670.1 ABC transporter substrate-binding protein [Abditibacteriales bacterium]